jgi:aconitate hydratase
MSPPLVVAFALAGRIDIDLVSEPLGAGKDGKPVFLRDIWPSSQEIEKLIEEGLHPEMFTHRYANIMQDADSWRTIKEKKGAQYPWDPKSTYIQNPPYFEYFAKQMPKPQELRGMRCLAIFGDSVTTDHISPAGNIKEDTPAGKYLLSLNVSKDEFNSYGSRRGNHNVMMRGTFANVRIKNKMAGGKEGGYTKLIPEGTILPIFDACQSYATKNIPLIVFAGRDYGMGSSRDWAAKGTFLLGVRAVVAESFERIHRSNLIGMGVLPLEFKKGSNCESLHIQGDELFSIVGETLEITRGEKIERIPLTIRIDTPIEMQYYQNGGIMPYVLRRSLS